MTKKKIAMFVATVVGLGVFGFGGSQAEAANPWGCGIRAGGGALQIGRSVHRGGAIYGQPHGGYYGQPHRSYYGGRYLNGRGRGHYDWHDTSHYDWHPTEIRRHGFHYDVIPGHYDFHREGHYDFHRGGHGPRSLGHGLHH